MEKHNTCYTYFDIRGDFDPAEVTRRLGLRPWRCSMGRGCAHWSFGRCDTDTWAAADQMRAVIAPLWGKLAELDALRLEYDAFFWLEVVPEIWPGEPVPCLAPPLDVMAFCLATGTRLDIDLYVYDPSEAYPSNSDS